MRQVEIVTVILVTHHRARKPCWSKIRRRHPELSLITINRSRKTKLIRAQREMNVLVVVFVRPAVGTSR